MSIEVSCFICDDVRKEVNGKHILIGVYNDIIVFKRSDWDRQEGKAILGKLVFANMITGATEGRARVHWWLEDPKGQLFVLDEKQEQEAEFKRDPSAIFIQISGAVQFTVLGTYTFHLQIDDGYTYIKRFDVRLQ